jgi:cytochrome c peroxidase
MVRIIFVLFVLCLLFACASKMDVRMYKQHISSLPKQISGNVNAEEVALGHYLFFDTRLSVNNTKSCGSCHNPNLFFTDGYKKTFGAFADVQQRNTPSLINAVFNKHLNWASKNITTFQLQMQAPLFDATHLEMGMKMDAKNVLDSLQKDEAYIKLLRASKLEKLSWTIIINAIAAYEKTLISFNSAFDKKEEKEFCKEVQLGKKIFYGSEFACANCHGGNNFNEPKDGNVFGNNAVHRLPNDSFDFGLADETKLESDKNKFRIPSLRNCMNTAPYMHNGAVASMNQVLFMFVAKRKFTNEENKQLISFLETLTDSTILQNPVFANPWH